MNKIPLIVIGGPTASGKTSLSIELAKRLNGEIVSADSVQVYKYFNIGSAKPTKEEMDGIPHHLIDEIGPELEFSVAEYAELAHEYIADIYLRGKIPIVVGGTGLYINSVVNDMEFGESDINESLRDELYLIAKEKGGKHLIEILREFDPLSAEKLHENNIVRIIRAIEFYETNKIPISKHQENTKQIESRYNAVMFAIDWDREILYDRINRRVDMMVEDGLLQEVHSLMDMGYTRYMRSMKGIGYKEVVDYFRGLLTFDEMKNVIKRDSRRYAKRQLTWFRRDNRIHWLEYSDKIYDDAIKIINDEIKIPSQI